MTQRDRDRQAALGWIAGQLAWEIRLQNLRAEGHPPTGGVIDVLLAVEAEQPAEAPGGASTARPARQRAARSAA